MFPARPFERVGFHGFERGCGVLEALSGEVHLELGEKRLALLIVCQRDGYAVLMVWSSRLHDAKFRAHETPQSGGRLPAQLMSHCAAPATIRTGDLSSVLWAAAFAATLLRKFCRTCFRGHRQISR